MVLKDGDIRDDVIEDIVAQATSSSSSSEDEAEDTTGESHLQTKISVLRTPPCGLWTVPFHCANLIPRAAMEGMSQVVSFPFQGSELCYKSAKKQVLQMEFLVL